MDAKGFGDSTGRDLGDGTIVEFAVDITERKQAEAALAEETRTLETLNRTGAAVAAELDQERLVQVVTDAGVELSGAAFGAFFYNVLDERGESYTLYALSGAPREAFARFSMPRNLTISGTHSSDPGRLKAGVRAFYRRIAP